MLALLSTAGLLLSVDGYSPDEVRARVEQAPRIVAEFIERRALCNHFLGEEPYDDERAADLNRAIRELRCKRIDRDERKLRLAYRSNVAILQLLDETADLLGW